MDQNCVFCKIAAHQQDSDILCENDRVIVISDIMPKAPVHLLVMPKEHIVSVNDIDESNSALAGEIIQIAKQQAKDKGIAESGYKLVFNVGKDGGQIIPHLHLHVLGGKQLPK